MIRVDIETIIMASGPVPSVIVLRERSHADGSEAPLRTLSIQTGSFEAAAISRGIDGSKSARPITHDLFVDALQALDVKVERIEINHVDAPIFFSKVVLARRDEDDAVHEVALDARPSDAIALAVRCNTPIYVEDDVMNRAGTVSFRTEQAASDEEVERFDRFVQSLSPDDF